MKVHKRGSPENAIRSLNGEKALGLKDYVRMRFEVVNSYVVIDGSEENGIFGVKRYSTLRCPECGNIVEEHELTRHFGAHLKAER